ncbi:MAG: class I SAM-dependent methyltransferase [Desulfobacteraceae bacterium]|jgi:2-polyprenyl-3-methyl-5-hydroxy-6-metoxy-1,4-benzoquinol methylase|nr:class I SAM-dependent methyltransferase [Desulfobacteraceae bacterium]
MTIPPQLVLEDVACPLGCPRADDAILAVGDRLHGLPGRFQVVRCRTCGLMRTNPRPTPETIGFYYPEDYHPYCNTRVAGHSGRFEALKARIKPLARRLFEFNGTRLPPLAPGRMLEVGCASGVFMHQMARQGWDVSGIEFSAEAAGHARALGYPVHAGPLETAPDPAAPVDLVVGWMVLEHLHRPIDALRRLHRWTRPGGWLAISVPNAASREFWLFKQRWYALMLPTHLYHFTPVTLMRVLHVGGWRIQRIFHQRYMGNAVGSLGYLLQDRRMLPALARWLRKFPEKSGLHQYAAFPLAYLASLAGQTGRMTVWARREN